MLREVVVRPLRRGELAPWQEAMARFHYLGDGRIVGETLRYVAERAGRWVALVGWGAAALKIRHREAFVGWDEKTKYQRLHLVANNVRFLILPWVEVPHLASVVLSRNLRRLSADWEARYDHPILLAETFIDLARFHGTCYRAANWIYLGQTRGMGRKGEGFAAHGQPKGLFVYPLHRRAKEILSAPFPAPEMKGRSPMSTVSIDVNKLPLEGRADPGAGAGPLDHRERPPLGARRPLRRGPQPDPERQWAQGDGHAEEHGDLHPCARAAPAPFLPKRTVLGAETLDPPPFGDLPPAKSSNATPGARPNGLVGATLTGTCPGRPRFDRPLLKWYSSTGRLIGGRASAISTAWEEFEDGSSILDPRSSIPDVCPVCVPPSCAPGVHHGWPE